MNFGNFPAPNFNANVNSGYFLSSPSVTNYQTIASNGTGPSSLAPSENNYDSLQSFESDTLTDDSDEVNNAHNLSENKLETPYPSTASSECHGREESDSESEERKYTVAQLVSAFNKHQEVASRTSLEAIMTEKRVVEDSLNFPIGAKALRLFIPDINISEKKPLVRRKTSYKPRKDWEQLRKQNEKNEGMLKKDEDNDSGNEEDEGVHLEDEGESKIEEKLLNDRVESLEDSEKSKKNELIEDKTVSISTPPTSPASIDSGVNELQRIDATEATEMVDSPSKESSQTNEDLQIVNNIKESRQNNGTEVECSSNAEKLVKGQIEGLAQKFSKDEIAPNHKKETTQRENKPQKSAVPAKETLTSSNRRVGAKTAPEKARLVPHKAESFKESAEKPREVPTRKVNSFKETSMSGNQVSSRLSLFAYANKTAGLKKPQESRSRVATKEKLCTGTYVRAMEKFGSKSGEKKPSRSRRTSATTQHP